MQVRSLSRAFSVSFFPQINHAARRATVLEQCLVVEGEGIEGLRGRGIRGREAGWGAMLNPKGEHENASYQAWAPPFQATKSRVSMLDVEKTATPGLANEDRLPGVEQ